MSSISGIHGMGGIGKTALAVHVAHQLMAEGRFRDAQLYLDLKGTDPVPVEPVEALESLLNAVAGPNPTARGRWRRGEGNHLGNLGIAYADLGEMEKAIGYHEQALAIAREISDWRGEGNSLANLGLIYRDQGGTAHARECWTRALALFEAIQDPNAERVRGWLAELG